MQKLTKGLFAMAVAVSTVCGLYAAPALTPEDVGLGLLPGQTIVDGDTITVEGGGADIWGTADAFHYAYFPVTGDFDYILNVDDFIGNGGDGGWSKVELMARNDDGLGYPSPGDPHLSNMTTRKASDTRSTTATAAPAGVNVRGPQWRAIRDNQSSWTTPNPAFPPNYPDGNWMRMERVGSTFWMYTSNDGVTWNGYNPYVNQGWDTAGSWPPGTDNPAVAYFTNAWPDTILLGIAVTAHSAADISIATLSDFRQWTPVPIQITQQPPATLAISANSELNISVQATGDPLHYQWLKDGVAITASQAAPSSVSSTYNIPLAQVSDSGTYTVRLFGANQTTVVSDPCVVTITVDTTPPTLVGASASSTFTDVIVEYSEPIADSALTPGNYALSPIAGVQNVTRIDAFTVALTTARLAENTAYTLTVNNVLDTAGNVIAANSTAEFMSFAWMPEVVLHKFWENATANNIDALLNDPRYPNSPTWSSIEPRAEWPADGGNEGGSNYGNMLEWWFIPPETTQYIFFVNGDDPAWLYLSEDADPANAHNIAQETGWSNPRMWLSVGAGDATSKASDTFTGNTHPGAPWIELTAGERYYMRIVHTEGGGGDNASATYITIAEPNPAEPSEPRFTGAAVGTYLDPTGAAPVFSVEPQDIDTVANATATFTSAATTANVYGIPVTYQWQLAPSGSGTFTDIAGATEASYTTPILTVANNGEKYRVVASALFSSTSAEATLSVTVDTVPPAVTEVTPVTWQLLNVRFSEPVTSATANLAGNYGLSGGATVDAATLSADGFVATLTTAVLTDDTSYTLTLNNIADSAGNVIAANSTMSFRTYAFQTGKIQYSRWLGIPTVEIEALTSSPDFPHNPTDTTFLTEFYAPDQGIGDFGGQLKGWVTPPSSGSYVFFVSADDRARLFLSTDDNPANKRLIAIEPNWSNPREWLSTEGGSTGVDQVANAIQKRSDTFSGSEWTPPNNITLTAGQRYYIEVLYKEGGGGDNAAVTWKLASQPDPANDSPALSGDVIAVYAPIAAENPALSVAIDGDNLIITFEGTLQEADALGTWSDTTLTSPATITPSATGNKFYRAWQ